VQGEVAGNFFDGNQALNLHLILAISCSRTGEQSLQSQEWRQNERTSRESPMQEAIPEVPLLPRVSHRHQEVLGLLPKSFDHSLFESRAKVHEAC
jgi:hypothetical protein